MRVAVLALLAPSLALAEPTQLPKVCAPAEAPFDEPCTALKGRYKIELAPRKDTPACVLTKPVTGILTISSEGRKPSFDAKPLAKAIGLRPQGKDDTPELGADIRKGVCCMDLRLYGRVGTRSQRVLVKLAAGARVVTSKARHRWMADKGPDGCGDEELDVTVTKL